MRGKNKLILIFTILFLFLILSFFLASLVSSQLDLSKEQSDKRARYIITLSEASSSEKTNSLKIMEKKQVIYSKINKTNVKKDFGDRLSVFLTDKEKQDLISAGLVKSIEKEKYLQIDLQNSTRIINASASWALQSNNLNLTGKDQAVCIIDTGVDYTNPSLGSCYGNNSFSSGCKIWGGLDWCADNTDCMTWDYDPEDVNGHGTHVSGIVAANGTITGVAPEARIIMFKACNISGSCIISDVIDGIEWCTNNASAFNISVISMSFGGGSYTDYCNDDIFASYINAAVAKNISVVVAAGNSGSTSAISSPACVQNAIPVSATTKADVIDTSYASRNFMVQLVAPGTDINSTYTNPAYWELSGTSMATPHVAGAIAILNEYLKLSSQTKTPGQIESILNSTGKQITDVGSGLTFSRISIYNGLMNLDNQAPNVSLVSPANNTLNESTTQFFTCNATDWQLANLTFYLWNSSGLVYNETKITTGASNQTTFNATSLSGTYKWNCLSKDLMNNQAYLSSNYTFTSAFLTSSLISPNTNNFTNIDLTYFNCSGQTSSNYLLNSTIFYLWDSSNNLVKNETKTFSGILNSSIFNYTFTTEDNYKWNCFLFNNISNSSYASSNYTITYDKTSPIVNLISPLNDSSYTTANTITFSYNITENFNISNCSLIVDNQVVSSNSDITDLSASQTLSKSLSAGNHNWSINCSDRAGNQNSSDIRNFSVSQASSPPGGGGGGGGSTNTVKTEVISLSSSGSSYNKALAQSEKVELSLSSSLGNHTLTLSNLGTNFAVFILQSNPMTLILAPGDEKKIDLNNDSYYDLDVKLNSILYNKANITVKSLYESINVERPINRSISISDVEPEPEPAARNTDKKGYIIVFVIIVVAFIAIIILIFRKLNKKPEPKTRKKTKK